MKEEDYVYCCLFLAVQLVGGSVPNEGRLEVYLNGEWGTVNRDGFGMTDANVACRSLGYGDARNYVTTPVFGRGTGSILMDDLACHGTEESIFDCNYNRRHESSDTHDQDVGVRCQNRGLGRFNNFNIASRTVLLHSTIILRNIIIYVSI